MGSRRLRHERADEAHRRLPEQPRRFAALVPVYLAAHWVRRGVGNTGPSESRGVGDRQVPTGSDQNGRPVSSGYVKVVAGRVAVNVEPRVVVAPSLKPAVASVPDRAGADGFRGGPSKRVLKHGESRGSAGSSIDARERFAKGHRVGVVIVDAGQEGTAAEVHDAGCPARL